MPRFWASKQKRPFLELAAKALEQKAGCCAEGNYQRTKRTAALQESLRIPAEKKSAHVNERIARRQFFRGYYAALFCSFKALTNSEIIKVQRCLFGVHFLP
jgi:hypothetical protein